LKIQATYELETKQKVHCKNISMLHLMIYKILNLAGQHQKLGFLITTLLVVKSLLLFIQQFVLFKGDFPRQDVGGLEAIKNVL